MRKLKIIFDLFRVWLLFVVILAGTFIVLLFLSYFLLAVLEITGAQKIPQVGKLFKDLFGFWVIFGGVLIFLYTIPNGYNPSKYFATLTLSWLLSFFVSLLAISGVINLENLINNIKQPSQPSLEISKIYCDYYKGVSKNWLFWLGVGSLPIFFLALHFTEKREGEQFLGNMAS